MVARNRSVVRLAFAIPVVDSWTDRPRLNRALLWSTLVEEAMMREWIVNLGARPADQRVAHLLLELLHRLRSVGLATDKDYAFPMSQQMLGIDEAIEPVRVSADGSVPREIYAGSRTKGGLTRWSCLHERRRRSGRAASRRRADARRSCASSFTTRRADGRSDGPQPTAAVDCAAARRQRAGAAARRHLWSFQQCSFSDLRGGDEGRPSRCARQVPSPLQAFVDASF